MKNPFDDLAVKSEADLNAAIPEDEIKLAKRKAIYEKYDPMVNEILDLFIAAHQQSVLVKGSDCSRRYCCHIAWFAGPKEKFTDPYDINHTIRRWLEIRLEMDGLCNPIGFVITQYAAIVKSIHTGLEKDDLVRGIQQVMR